MTQTDKELLKKMTMRCEEAYAFRRIVILMLTGVNDTDPKKFVTEVKLIVQEAASKGV